MDEASGTKEQKANRRIVSARPSIAARMLIACVRGYQIVLGPILGGSCRFSPSCSFYALDALRQHGAWRGGKLTMKRLVRCHPWGGHGHDPVP
ncbi:MAG: membrane protein insertion efficiency factor YidD [Planctomycetota bacterium]|nr:MAG: membrane protein insertion efficiency factor YidD [Planctomycetota bacterium]RLS95090.1 MAG: membrane protein insertion efficiency factor YidD [Planctomycetota bacterium]